ILDQWMHYGIRFSSFPVSKMEAFLKNKNFFYVPTRILLMDEFARQELMREGLPREKLFVTGQPHFQAFRENKYIEQARVCSIRNSFFEDNKDTRLVVFASEPITEDWGETVPYFGYSEKTILTSFLQSLKDVTRTMAQKVCLVIRPHPREEFEKFEQILNERFEEFNILVSNDYTSRELIEASDVVCGMSSMFLLESVLLGKPTISIQIGLKGESFFILDKLNVLKSIMGREELTRKLYEILVDGKYQKPQLNFIRDPIQKVIDQVGSCFELDSERMVRA
ncbi:hypothetical protein KAR91_30870, partial [Candidatus Pacearchaeota archaeon]|nr:hypothetical protein [Candidatus Pacearchaeota archaeon]